MRILVAEDDAALASFVKKGLESEHYAVDVSTDGEQARAMAGELDFDLVVLDLNLPRLDGVSILRFLRTRKPSIPILVLTGRTRVEDRVLCLDLGADDYLGKPFSFVALSARIRALMRRSHLPAESVLAVDDLKLYRVERRVERAGRRIELTSKEFCLLEYLMRNAGRRITRAMIIEHVWNLSFDTCTNVVDVYVNYLRRKVDDGYGKHLIHTIRGVGYELSARSQSGPVAGPGRIHEGDHEGKSSGDGGIRNSPTRFRSASPAKPAPDHLVLFAGVGAASNPQLRPVWRDRGPGPDPNGEGLLADDRHSGAV